MKILVINGSPKKEKSDTMHITRAFLAGINEVSENEIKVIDASLAKVNYCKGDLICKTNGGICPIKDDMKEINNAILNCDLLLFSFPLYNYSFPASVKAILDRTLPLSAKAMVKVDDHYEHTCQKDFSKKKYVMISGSGFPNQKHNFDAVILQFKYMFPHNQTLITVPEAPLFNAKEADSITKPFLDFVKICGHDFGENGYISEKNYEKLAIPMIPEEMYAKICSKES